MAGHLKRLGERISELHQGTPVAVVARRAGITPAYLHAIENAAPNRKTGQPSQPSIPVVRSIAFAIPGAVASELLELAGYPEEDIIFDRIAERKLAALEQAATTSTAGATNAAVAAALRRYVEELEAESGEPLDAPDEPGAQRLHLAPPNTRRTDSQGRKGTA